MCQLQRTYTIHPREPHIPPTANTYKDTNEALTDPPILTSNKPTLIINTWYVTDECSLNPIYSTEIFLSQYYTTLRETGFNFVHCVSGIHQYILFILTECIISVPYQYSTR